jgi:CheY-like chemotaxis protein
VQISDSPPVLVVDDDAAVRSVVVEYLGIFGRRVVEAENGLQALLQIKHHRPGAVILDLRMPRLGGLDVLKRIRQFDPTIQVVVITGDLSSDTHRVAEELGAQLVLPKPIDLDRLRVALGLVEEAPEVTAIQATPQVSTNGSRSVLVVDDDAEARGMLEQFLTAWGYRPRSVADGAAALRFVSREAPDVILLDVEMPGLSGTDALPAIRALAPESRVIMVSGNTSTDALRRARALGVADYIVKPVDLDLLARSLETVSTMKRTR